MMKLCLLVVKFSLALTWVNATDYCSKDLCNDTLVKHIGCDRDDNWDESCPSDALLIDLKGKYKRALLSTHNRYRNLVAGGSVRGLQRACRMATMIWSDELAKLATFNVQQCAIAYDKCHNTDAFKHSGQNLALNGIRATTHDVDKFLTASLNSWFTKVSHTDDRLIRTGHYLGSRSPASQFILMITEQNTHLGCAIARYTRNGFLYLLLACNYATNIVKDQRIYSICLTSAVHCKNGTHQIYDYLCSTAERYNNNN